MINYDPAATTSWEKNMYRLVVALFVLVGSAVAASAQGLFPSVWLGQGGSILKVLAVGPAGNFSGVFISNPTLPCPAVPYNLAGSMRGPFVAFTTSRTWTLDCRATTVWRGRLVNPGTVAVTFVATTWGPTGIPIRVRGTEIFRRI